MGPLFFRAENEHERPLLAAHLRASMGPLFFRAENRVATVADLEALMLQWGRSFSERRTVQIAPPVDGLGDASMGPLFFRAENPQLLTVS